MSSSQLLPAPRRWRLAPLGFVLALVAAEAAPSQAAVFDPVVHELNNGLQVVVVPNHRAHVVTHMVWYKVGSADEPPGKSGIAHYLEHLMFKGTDEVEPQEFSRIVAQHGGRDNAMTSYDFTAYFQTVASDQLGLVMELEADRMVDLQLTDEVALPERDVVLEERLSRTENEPSGRLAEMARAAQFMHHPYGTPVIGWQHELRNLTAEDALDFYETWYVPNNAAVVIAGDVDPQEAIELAEKHYGDLPARIVPARERLAEPQQWAPRRVELASARVGQPSLSISYLAPSYNRTLNDSSAGSPHALEVASELLSGRTGALYRKLVVEEKLAAGVSAHYSPDAFDLTTFSFSGTPRPGTELEELEAAIRGEIERLLQEGVANEEVERAKQRLIDAAVFARDSASGPAFTLGRAIASGGSVADVEAWPERIEAVTAEQVEAALGLVLQPERSVTSLLRPEPTS